MSTNQHQPPRRIGPADPELLAADLEAAAQFTNDQWAQGYFFQDAQGNQLDYFSTNAVRFSANGFLILRTGYLRTAYRALCDLFRALLAEQPDSPYRHLAEWNDAPGRTPTEVRAFFREAAAHLRQMAQTAQSDDHPPGAAND